MFGQKMFSIVLGRNIFSSFSFFEQQHKFQFI